MFCLWIRSPSSADGLWPPSVHGGRNCNVVWTGCTSLRIPALPYFLPVPTTTRCRTQANRCYPVDGRSSLVHSLASWPNPSPSHPERSVRAWLTILGLNRTAHSHYLVYRPLHAHCKWNASIPNSASSTNRRYDGFSCVVCCVLATQR